MGRWAQARHRGRGGPAPVPASLPVPVDPDNFTVSGADSLLTVTTFGPFPAGADQLAFRWRVLFNPVWIEGAFVGADDGFNLEDPATPGQVWEVQARWVNFAHASLSDFCASSIATITA